MSAVAAAALPRLAVVVRQDIPEPAVRHQDPADKKSRIMSNTKASSSARAAPTTAKPGDPGNGPASAPAAPASPSWLTPQLLTAALREEDETSGQVTTIRVRPATAANENYLSELMRVHAHIGKGEVRRLIVKANPVGEAACAMVQAAGLFDRETKAIRDTLPRLQRELAAGLSHRPAEQLQIGPAVIAVLSNGALVMEDLCAKGYTNVPRRGGLDLPHSLVAVRLLARMHAASVVLHDRSAEDARALESFSGSWTSATMRPLFEKLVTVSMVTLATAVRAWPRLGEDVSRRLQRAEATAFARAEASAACKEGAFQVLCHGDCWSNNIMFAYDEDTAQVRSALFVDFQMASWGSPAMDLLHFLALSSSPAVRRGSTGRVVRAYHAELAACLAAMGWRGEPPSLVALQREVRKREFWAFICTACLLPIRYVQTGLALDTQCFLEKDNALKIQTLNDPACRADLEELLPDYIERGFLD